MHVKATNGIIDQYPYTVGQLRRDNKSTQFPKHIPDWMLAEHGVYPVTEQDRPDIDDRTQTTEQNALPTLISGAWVLGWSVADRTAAQVAEYDETRAVAIRAQRDALLTEGDWRTTKAYETGVPLSAEWLAYRQALREITLQEGFPYAVEWPVKSAG